MGGIHKTNKAIDVAVHRKLGKAGRERHIVIRFGWKISTNSRTLESDTRCFIDQRYGATHFE